MSTVEMEHLTETAETTEPVENARLDELKDLPIPPGYRLQYMELFNWGTFDGQIYTIKPEGRSSLLTGANGSGKTTLIDAMLTLLVPERKYRFYNQSSGAEKKTERSEESYVMGHYGNIQEAGRTYSTAQKLRKDKNNTYSVLLACFENHKGQHVTLAQCRWFGNQDLKRSWVIAYESLTIAEDLTPFDPRGQWKRDLKAKYPPKEMKDSVEFFDAASKYARRMMRVFGMRSPKALTLFNQTVGIKVLGDLNVFIRDNMLEAGDTKDLFANLKNTYKLLLNAKNAMDKAEKQLEMLKPVKELAETVSVLEGSLVNWQRDRQIADLYFASRRRGELESHIEKSRAAVKDVRAQIDQLNEKMEQSRDDKESLARAMQSDETGQELALLNRQIQQLEQQKKQRQEALTRYNLLAKALHFVENPDESNFRKNLKKCQESTSEVQNLRRELAQKGFQSQRDMEDHLKDIKLRQSEIQQLSQQKNNITGRVAEIREELAEHLGISPAQLPFVAELIQVNPEAREWEAVIEKLLKGFAIRLIVPEKYYSQVNNYVNRVNLRGRLVYHKVPENYMSDKRVFAPPKALVNKLMFHPESTYSAWVKDQIISTFDFLCADTMGEFESYRKAITREGLIKAASRHEKDDRSGHMGRSQYILGWTNSGKVDHIIADIHAAQEKVEACLKEQKELQDMQGRQDWQLKNIAKFEELTDYDVIDWESVADRLEALYQQQLNLENSGGDLQSLKQQVDAFGVKLQELEQERLGYIRREQELLTGIEDYRNQLEEAEQLLKNARLDGEDLSAEALSALHKDFEERFAENLQSLRLDNVALLSRALKEEIERRVQGFRQRLEATRRQLERAMMTFKRPDKELLARFPDWASETYKLPEDIAYIDDYLSFYKQLEQDDLPSYTREFERYLTTHMIQKMADFRESFYQREQKMLKTIEELNLSLDKIDFRRLPLTYIQLQSVKTHSPSILTFKEMLDAWVPVSENDGIYDIENLKQSFEAIRTLIEKLDSEEHWKKQVTDVRRWNEYYAEEFFRESGKPMKVYRSMGELSGGEKAQLTYTILGSAIAYQFGIAQSTNEASQSFRFIAVDESFSNQDDEKATYLMDLCKQLHLQLLVVTPNDKTHIVEPYISSVHFVYRRSNQSSHLLDMPIIEFQNRRNEWQAIASVMS